MNRLGLFADSRSAIFKNNFCSAMKWRRARMTVDRRVEAGSFRWKNLRFLKRLVDRRRLAIKLTSERKRRFGRCAWSWWFHSGPISAMHPSVICDDKENKRYYIVVCCWRYFTEVNTNWVSFLTKNDFGQNFGDKEWRLPASRNKVRRSSSDDKYYRQPLRVTPR